MQVDLHPDRVPGAEVAIIEDSKLLEYALSLEHSVGRAKAVFFQSIDYTRDEYEDLTPEDVPFAVEFRAALYN